MVTILRAQDENAGLEAALGAARAQLRELEGAYDLAAAADSLNTAALAAAEEELAAARCESTSLFILLPEASPVLRSCTDLCWISLNNNFYVILPPAERRFCSACGHGRIASLQDVAHDGTACSCCVRQIHCFYTSSSRW